MPISTLYYWARTELVVPSVSALKVKKWSYADLLVLRLIDWLRQEKLEDAERPALPKPSMTRIRKELSLVESLGGRLMDESIVVEVDPSGRLHFSHGTTRRIELGGSFQQLESGTLDLVRPFELHVGMVGPDLVRPGETLRIIPGKLSGEPHIEATRIQTQAIGALDSRGLEPTTILELYPALELANVTNAIVLEKRLAENLRHEAA